MAVPLSEGCQSRDVFLDEGVVVPPVTQPENRPAVSPELTDSYDEGHRSDQTPRLGGSSPRPAARQSSRLARRMSRLNGVADSDYDLALIKGITGEEIVGGELERGLAAGKSLKEVMRELDSG